MQPAVKIEQVNGLLSLAGKRVRRLRDERVLTRKQLARTSRVSERHLAQLELGRSNISLALLDRIALALDTSVANLVGHEEPARSQTRPRVGHRTLADTRPRRHSRHRSPPPHRGHRPALACAPQDVGR